MQKKFELMQAKGVLDVKTLAEFGIKEDKINQMMQKSPSVSALTPKHTKVQRRLSAHSNNKSVPSKNPN